MTAEGSNTQNGQPLTAEQLGDISVLLARSLSRENLIWLVTSVLGKSGLQEAGNEIGESSAFARRAVAAMHKAGRLQDAVLLLIQEGPRNGTLSWKLNHILRGKRLDDSESEQALVNEVQPFFSVEGFEDSLKRIKRTICAVALGTPHNRIMGSGFLIGPDLVMTNYHVIEYFLTEQADLSIKASAPGEEIYCIFDYLLEPAPQVPPGTAKHTSTVVRGAKDWLVYARQKLPFDGTTKCASNVTYEYDYAIIRLAKAIGNFPIRQGGGTIRGWLPIPGTIDVFLPRRRLMVFQHPGGYAQQFDIGESVGLDQTSTRIRYRVSTAKGSSGGAAVDTDGGLFALHNAEVDVAGTPLAVHGRVNQGVRIDRIAADLAAASIAVSSMAAAAGKQKVQFWSLNDDPQDPQPIIGRTMFKDIVKDIHSSDTPRVAVVTGPPGHGVQFSIRLLQRTLGPQAPVVVFSPKELQTLGPRDFIRAFLDEVGIEVASGDKVPEPRETENVPRWLRLDLPKWICKYLDRDRDRRVRPYPIWVVLNAMVPAGEHVLWAENLKDFVATLAGAHDPGQSFVDLPQLRWLFLGQKIDELPVSGIPHRAEDLTSDQSYESDFAECMQLAWRSVVDNQEQEIPEVILLRLATDFREGAGAEPIRKVLASKVRKLIIGSTKGTGRQ